MFFLLGSLIIIENSISFVEIFRNFYSSNNVEETVLSISNSYALEINELIIEKTNLLLNNYSYLFNKTGGALLCENLQTKSFRNILFKDNFSARTTVGIRIIDNSFTNSFDLLYKTVSLLF